MNLQGRPLDNLPPRTTPRTAPKPKPDDEKKRLVWTKLVTEFAKHCEAQLWTDVGKTALEYLHNRGLSDKTIRRAKLGYNARDQRVANAWAQRGITIPWFHDGEITHCSIRRPPGTDPKYGSISPSKKTLFYVPGDRQALCIVEGEFDCLLFNQETELSCAATGSAKYISDELSWLATSFKTLVIIPDDDEAGEKMAAIWRQTFSKAQVLHVPTHDITDYYTQGGNLMDWWQRQNESVPDWVTEQA